MNEWMNRKHPLYNSHDQALHEFGEYLWIEGSNCCLHQCFRAWWYSFLSGTCVLLDCSLLYACANSQCRDMDRCGFGWINSIDTLLGGRNERWPSTTWDEEKEPFYFPKAGALLLIESNLLHAEYMGLGSIRLQKCPKHSQFLAKHRCCDSTAVPIVVFICDWKISRSQKGCPGNAYWNWSRSPENLV